METVFPVKLSFLMLAYPVTTDCSISDTSSARVTLILVVPVKATSLLTIPMQLNTSIGLVLTLSAGMTMLYSPWASVIVPPERLSFR